MTTNYTSVLPLPDGEPALRFLLDALNKYIEFRSQRHAYRTYVLGHWTQRVRQEKNKRSGRQWYRIEDLLPNPNDDLPTVPLTSEVSWYLECFRDDGVNELLLIENEIDKLNEEAAPFQPFTLDDLDKADALIANETRQQELHSKSLMLFRRLRMGVLYKLGRDDASFFLNGSAHKKEPSADPPPVRQDDLDKSLLPGAPRLTVDVKVPIVTLDGELIPVDHDGAHFIEKLIAARGEYITEKDLGTRPDKIKRRLPRRLTAFIEAQPGKGQRIIPAMRAELRLI